MATGIDRANSNDLMVLATDVGSAPMQVGAILVLDSGSRLESATFRDAIAERIRGVPRLRQRLLRTPFGAGRPIWVDATDFDIENHVRCVRCPAPGDEHALLDVAAEIVIHPLSTSRPLWSATLVTGLATDRSALVFVFHHVLADGVGGLAVLGRLADGAPISRPGDFPRRYPTGRQLYLDALSSRARAIAQLRLALRHVRGAVAELGLGGRTAAPIRNSLNQPTGARRSFAVARTDLAAVREVAHAYGGTVNDVVLTTVAGALHALLRRRGEDVDHLVISVPVSARTEDTGARLGNQAGVIPIALPATGDPRRRLEAVADITRRRKTAPRAASTALLDPVFRAMVKLGAFQWFIDHQRLVNTVVTNVHGPESHLTFLGSRIGEIVPLSLTMGNITVAFAAMSYAGTLVITVVADPDHCSDLALLVEELQGALDALTGHPGSGR
jgi:diacylglycerol O-acyltransferase